MNLQPTRFSITGALLVLALAGCSNVLSNNPNRAPNAVVVSTDYTIAPGQSVTLDAGSSNDLDNQSLGYVWSITSAPTSGQYTLTGTTTSKPVFSTANMTNGVLGVYTAKVVVTDKYNLTDTKSVTIRVTEAITPSITNTTATVYPGVTSSPVGSAAYTGSTLGIGTFSYSWAYTSTTATTASYTLGSTATATASFASSFYAAGATTSPTYTTPAYLGNYVLTLTVTDSYGVSASTTPTTTNTVADTAPTVTSLTPTTNTAATGATVTLTGVAADVDTAGRNNLKTSSWAQSRGPVDHSLTVPSGGTDSNQSQTAVTGTDTVTLPTLGVRRT